MQNQYGNRKLNISFTKHLLEQNRPILRIFASEEEQIDRKTYELMCLPTVLCFDGSIASESNFHFVLDFTAENVVDVSLQNASVNFPCGSRFPKLLYLTIQHINFGIPHPNIEFPDCPNLRHFYYEGECVNPFRARLLTWLNLQEKLKTIYFNLSTIELELTKLTPPPNLERLIYLSSCEISQQLDNTNVMKSMKFIQCRCLNTHIFECPNLTVFDIETESLTEELVNSLSKCIKLQKLRLRIRIMNGMKSIALHLQSLVDHFVKISCLKHVEIVFKDDLNEKDGIVALI